MEGCARVVCYNCRDLVTAAGEVGGDGLAVGRIVQQYGGGDTATQIRAEAAAIWRSMITSGWLIGRL